LEPKESGCPTCSALAQAALIPLFFVEEDESEFFVITNGFRCGSCGFEFVLEHQVRTVATELGIEAYEIVLLD